MTPSQSQPSPTVRVAAAADVAAVSAVLGRAFDDDPVWGWLLPDEASRVRRLGRLFGVALRHVHLPHAASEAAGRDGAVEAAAFWDPPDHWKVSAGRQLSLLGQLLGVFGTRLPIALRTLGAIEEHHPREPHWYLAVLGTDPPAQGLGLGGALLRSRLDRCDASGVPAYLESSKERNVPYYERFGFRVTRELALPGKGCPPVWLMWRDPEPPGERGTAGERGETG
ncbi:MULTISPECIES: GNAT family N-acetyltransferase [Actinomadura]|uniref:GNAT family N-acetyltransferase n=1 Tax=Actinomadura litoris TaxID=2678616 RepID=A0A7K1LA87_9ACTN|nr:MULTISPECIES: GNAT family N-acetyltransferase [Actinomadura]MBT2213261.1 GNAT family N-acetyltransferase [Actinomadura sp. NEAU-AAG7]MUN41338.1 GNAT family N-acetyltransferase [Actinomadura litoris]